MPQRDATTKRGFSKRDRHADPITIGIILLVVFIVLKLNCYFVVSIHPAIKEAVS